MSKKTIPVDASLEVILCRWPHLPEYVRKTLVELLGHYGPQVLGGSERRRLHRHFEGAL